MPSRSDCHGCVKIHSTRDLRKIPPALALSVIPFLLTFFIVAAIAWRRLFPRLSGASMKELPERSRGVGVRRFSLTARAGARYAVDHAAAITFSTTIALSAVLAELIFCEISNILNPDARSLALKATISILLISLVVVTPALEIHSIAAAAGSRIRGAKRGGTTLALLFDVGGLAGWLCAFWWIGQTSFQNPIYVGENAGHRLSEGSLERIGIIGISLMASLAGFAAISSIWQTFGARTKTVTEADIARKQSGLDATRDILAVKQSRLRALERKMVDQPPESFIRKMLSSFRGSAEAHETATLQLEISGLESMQIMLSNALQLLSARRQGQQRASTAFGRVCLAFSHAFSIYCLYRIGATSLAFSRRFWKSRHASVTSDPITSALALVASMWDPTLDVAAWSRQLSFVISGLMLVASFNAVLQTVLLFSRFAPPQILQSAQQNLALLVSQVSATYVVSSALLLRSNLPKQMGSVIGTALKTPLDTAFVERWFEGWFLSACFLTMVGIAASKHCKSAVDWDDDDVWDGGDVEAGKQS